MSLSDKEYFLLTVSISKAVSGVEMPLKVKHARAAIIGTFHSRGAHSFWAVSLRQPLQENRITAWKFCHLLHKVLREGHALCLQHSMRHRPMLAELGKLWGHLNDGYGLCIRHYAKLLITKLEFHDRNPRFPGSLQLKRGELEQISGNDSNFYFQMAVEMFDYLDDVIALQATIFSAITTFHVNSMTSAGQCRLAPLIPLIQDSNQLYDFIVRIMFKLHTNLPNDVLGGHRDRFRAIFIQLKSFYSQSRNLQYFVNLISVPKLPENAPNFSSQVDFGAYTPPVVVIPEPDPEPEPEPEPIVDNLVDMSVPQRQIEEEQHQREPEAAPSVNFENIVRERDDLIMHLQGEVDRLGKYVKSVSVEYRDDHARLEEEVAELNAKLSDAHEELTNMRFIKEELELKAQTVEKYQAEEERAKASEEKFTKLKTLYTQIRDEHVKLLRQHGEVSKQLAVTTKLASDANKGKEELQSQLDEVQEKTVKIEESLQQSSSDKQREQDEYVEKIGTLETEHLQLKAQYEDMEANKAAEIAELSVQLDNMEAELNTIKSEANQLSADKEKLEEECKTYNEQKTELEHKLQDLMAQHQDLEIKCQDQSRQEEQLQQSVFEREETTNELNKRIEILHQEQEAITNRCEELQAAKTQSEEQLHNLMQKFEEMSTEKTTLEHEKEEAMGEIEILKNNLSEKINEFDKFQAEMTATITGKDNEMEELKIKSEEIETKYRKLNANNERLHVEKRNIECDFQDLLHEQEEMEEKYNAALSTIQALESSLEDLKIRDETRIRALVEACINSSKKLTERAMTENEVAAAAGTPTYFMMIAEELQTALSELGIVHDNYVCDNSNVEGLARKVVLCGHLMATVHIQGITIYNTSADIEYGERIADEIKKWSHNVFDLFNSLQTNNKPDTVKSSIEVVKSKLQEISNMIHDLSKKSNSGEQIADSIEAELAGMDKAIEEAASKIEELLSKSRKSDSGIKLEVNEKILDACNALMNSIRILVQKSRLVQAEIVSLGKGTASVKEFYKRNNQWTEGLISAAKSVAQGANFLVTAANKAVTGESKQKLDIIVAAQEIAACTAQLVVASRVKAPRGSITLSALGQASREVTVATGTVVATAKDCSQRLEESQDLDLTNLTVHQAKTLEMEIQVKVLELEQALQMERLRLAAFRRKNYRESPI